jgi:hypothetical protein
MIRQGVLAKWSRRLLPVAAGLLLFAGCQTIGLISGDPIAYPLPNAPGLTLEQLRDIQRDPTTTTDEKRALIREAINVPDTPEGNRVADFLLNLFIP